MTVRIPELRALARRRSLAVLAAALVMAGCAAPGAQVRQILSAGEVPYPIGERDAHRPAAHLSAELHTNPDACF